jgi:hypothetical protein
MPIMLEGVEDLVSLLTDMGTRNAGCITEGETSKEGRKTYRWGLS